MFTLRSFAETLISRLPPRLQVMAHWRFIKFGLVGASGTVINIAVLYVAQEFLLRGIVNFQSRLNFSIALAITLATTSNFYWNRRLTWRDRQQQGRPQSALVLFAKYVAAAGLSIVVQSLLTKWLALHMHYITANILSIVLASVCNFVANDRMTFRRRKAASSPSTVPSTSPITSPSTSGVNSPTNVTSNGHDPS